MRQERGFLTMGFKSDIEIAQEVQMQPITEIAAKAGIDPKYLEQYGNYKAKIDYNLLRESDAENGKLILVTAINPTPAGEGKTTTTVGLADGMQKLGKKVMVALREPSLGPVFGVKGGAAGGGYAQVVPMEDINLHFTGDFHAIGAANNLLAAMIDNHIFQGNELNIDPRKITWRRCVDMNDRQLRNVVDGLGGRTDGTPREDGYDITVASEIMAVLCLASDINDLKERLSRIVIGYTYGKPSEQKPVTAGQLNAQGAMAALLKDALKPNLVQTLEHVPAIVHGGPFANIAHGCNSVTATKMALKLADYTITEAGFGADLGAEKFLDIKCRMAGLKPNAVVIVATVRALKYNGGVAKADLNNENLEALEKGLPNLLQHVGNIKNVYGLPCVVAINAFPTDTKAELDLVEAKCKELGVNVALSEVWAKGGAGGKALAEEVLKLIERKAEHTYVYDDSLTIKEKIEAICTKVYGADGVDYAPNASKTIADFERLIGSQTESAEKKMLQRAKNQANALGGQIGGQKVDICPPEIKRLDIREKEKISIKKEKLALFTPPTIEEVTAYCKERGNNVDAEQFIAFYTSKGWMVGKNKMKDWKACIRTWERRDAKPTEIRYAQRNYTEEELAEIFKDKENFDDMEI